MTPKPVAACSASVEIERLVSAWAMAWNRHDIDAAAALVMPDVDFVNVFGQWLKGKNEFVDHHGRLHGMQMRDSTWSNLNHETRLIRDDLAIVHVEWTIEGDRDPDGNARNRRHGLFTWVLSRQDECWRIAAAHNTNLHVGVRHRLTPSPRL